MTQILTLKKLLSLRRSFLPHQTIVLVTGCFDLLHSAHKKFLKAAKQQGDILLIGLESDLRLRQLKGPNRPLNSLSTRFNNLAQLKLADYLFPLPEDFSSPQDHEYLIKTLRPHILAVSSHTPNLQAKQAILAKYGSKTLTVLPHNPNISTSQLIKPIKFK